VTKTLENFKINIKQPWYWVIIALFLTPILPIYITPILSIVTFIALLVKNKREKNKLFIGKMGMFIAAYCAFMFIGILYSKTKSVSLCMALLWTFLAMGFFATVNLIDSKEKFMASLKALTLGSLVTGIIAIIQYLSYTFKFYFPNPFWTPVDKVALELLKLLGFDFIVRFDVPILYRQSSTFLNPNVYGVFLLIVIPIVGVLAIISKSKKWRIFSLISIPVLTAALVVTESRGCYLALLIAIVLFVILARNKQLMSIIPISIIGMLLVPQTYVNRLLSLGNMDHSMQLRVEIWKVAFKTIEHNFIYGLGPGVQNFWNILKSAANINLPHAHNLILQILIEGGIIGFLIAGGIFGVFVMGQVKLYLSGENNGGKFKMLNDEHKLYNNPQMCNRIIASGFICMMVAFITQGMTDYVFLDPKIVQYFMFIMGLSVAIYRIHNKNQNFSSNK
jgi:O-antigen ligase